MAKTNLVTRRVTESRVIGIYAVNGTTLVPIEKRTVTGRVSEAKLAKELGVPMVFTAVLKENKKVYGVSTDEFMKIAVEVADDEVTAGEIAESNKLENDFDLALTSK